MIGTPSSPEAVNGTSRVSDLAQKCQEADKDLSVCIVEKGAEVGVLNSLVLPCYAMHISST